MPEMAACTPAFALRREKNRHAMEVLQEPLVSGLIEVKKLESQC
jgi:hypothetical protein